MANICEFELTVNGLEEDVLRVVNILEGEDPEYRVSRASVIDSFESDDGFIVYGECDWSVHSSMMTENNHICDDGKRFITLDKMAVMFNVSFLVDSREPGLCFSECGVINKDDTRIECLCYRDYVRDFEDDYDPSRGSFYDYVIGEFLKFFKKHSEDYDTKQCLTKEDIEVLCDDDDHITLRVKPSITPEVGL